MRSVCFPFILICLAVVAVSADQPAGDGLSTRTSGQITAVDRQYYAYQPVHRPVLPPVKDASWPQSPIDHFVLARLESRGISQVGTAVRRVLLRRATFDLAGLPPLPEHVADFLHDPSPDALCRVVDRLLASPRYGQRWGRHWLDVARYAEDVRQANYRPVDLPLAYRYRDWVIDALNKDLPYDRFVMMQIAGDKMPETGFDGHLATGFFAIGPVYGSDGGTAESLAKAAAETLDDKIDVLTRGFLGLTVSCARCHDHKFDPIPTEDYYSLGGALHNTNFQVEAPLVGDEVVQRFRQAREKIVALQKRMEEVKKEKADTETFQKLESELAQLRAAAPEVYPRAHAVSDSGSADMVVAVRGNPTVAGATVPRRMLRIIAGDQPPPFTQGSGRRELARAVADRDNPLVSRVMVNRIWQHHFGRAIVSTPDNFGRLGARPTHPLLLDWLAAEFIDGQWSMKRLHRQIMLSATYQLDSRDDDDNSPVDGDNQLLWRMNRRRLDVESLRDAMLSASGTLDSKMRGASDRNLMSSRRRTIYGRISRDNVTSTDKFLHLFDFPDANFSNSQRTVTTVPQQQLFLMNNPFVIEQASALARRVLEFTDDQQSRIRQAFAWAYGRAPSADELDLAQRFLDASNNANASDDSKWSKYAHILLASSEFMFVE